MSAAASRASDAIKEYREALRLDPGHGPARRNLDAALQSAIECAGKLRQKFGDRLQLNIGDHELGKFSMFDKRGGMRLRSRSDAGQKNQDGKSDAQIE